MIVIAGRQQNAQQLMGAYPRNSLEREIIRRMDASTNRQEYDSLEQLKFELRMRREIIQASYDLHRSRLGFEIFRESRANPAFWRRTGDGGFLLKSGVSPSEAIQDIFTHGEKYGTECATGMVIVYYKALLNIFGKDAFDRMFSSIHLMNWHYLDPKLREIGMMKRTKDFFPGDRRYVKNPDVNPLTPEWQGENIIDLGNGLFYGHGMGIRTVASIISELNKNRSEDADETAFLMDSAARPDFKRFADLYARSAAAA